MTLVLQGSSFYSIAGAPSLDLRFAESKSLTDYISGRNLVTFSRASDGATYVDSDGLVKRAATNLLLRSEEFDNASWNKARCSVVADAVAAPSGSVTADLLVEDGSNNTHRMLSPSTTVTANATVTASVYFKAKERSQIHIIVDEFTGAGGASFYAYFSSSGASGGATSGVASFTSASVQSLANGWYRAILTGSLNGGYTAYRFSVFPAVSGNIIYQGDGTSGIYIWGAQLEVGSTATEYLPTSATINSAPRFQHDPTTGACLGLLVEEQRSNLLLRSEEFDSTWVPGSVTATPNTTASPSGATNADTLTVTAGATNANLYQSVSCLASTSYTFSFYVRLGTLPAADLKFAVRDDSNAAFIAVDILPSVTPSVGEWRRIVYTFTTPVGCVLVRPYIFRNTSAAGGTFFAWGAQLEAGAFPTSYIPTTTASVTRSVDVASITGTAFSGWYNQGQGTVFCNSVVSQGLASFPWLYNITDGTINNSFGVYQFTNGIYGSTTSGGVGATDASNLFGPSPGSPLRHAFALQPLDSRAAVNGTLSGAQTNTVMPVSANALSIGQRVTGNRMTGTISRLTYWPRRLPDATLQALTV